MFYLISSLKNDVKKITSLRSDELDALFLHDYLTIKNIQDCESSDLEGVTFLDMSNNVIGVWPAYNQLLSPELVDVLGSLICQDPINDFITQATELLDSPEGQRLLQKNYCPDMEVKLTKDRSLFVTLIPREHVVIDYNHSLEQYFLNARWVHQLEVSSLPIFCQEFDSMSIAFSEKIDRNSDYQLSWLDSPEKIHQNLVRPYLEFIELLHHSDLTHGDITDSNVILSKRFEKLIFIDFKHIGEVKCVKNIDDDDDGYVEWQIARLTDLRDMCRTIVTNTIRIGSARDPVIDYIDGIAIRLEDIDACSSQQEFDEHVRANAELTIDTLIKDVLDIIHHNNQEKPVSIAYANEMKRMRETQPPDSEPKKTKLNGTFR